MFHRTIGGIVHSGDTEGYTFPDGAFFEINNIKIPLGGLRVECPSGAVDLTTTKHFIAGEKSRPFL